MNPTLTTHRPDLVRGIDALMTAVTSLAAVRRAALRVAARNYDAAPFADAMQAACKALVQAVARLPEQAWSTFWAADGLHRMAEAAIVACPSCHADMAVAYDCETCGGSGYVGAEDAITSQPAAHTA